METERIEGGLRQFLPRRPWRESPWRDVMKTRILVAIPLILFVLLAILLQGWVLAVFAVAVGLGCSFEVARALASCEQGASCSVSLALAIALAAMFCCDFALRRDPANSAALFSPELVLVLMMTEAVVAFVVCMFSRRGSFSMLQGTLFTFIYPQLLVVFFYLLVLQVASQTSNAAGVSALLMLFVPPALSDTLAYFWGRSFGRRKLCPLISPNKTVAGSVAGLVGGGIGGCLVWLLAFSQLLGGGGPVSGPVIYILSGFLLAFLSQIGDLAASYIKRGVGIKDFGRLLPGHGGVMDRVDSTLFVAPLVYLLTALGVFAVV